MPGASGLGSFDREPASVSDLLIDTLKKQVDQHNKVVQDKTMNFNTGDVVLIEDGLFVGHETIFVNISGEERVRVLLNLLTGRQMSIEIEGRQIRRVKRR